MKRWKRGRGGWPPVVVMVEIVFTSGGTSNKKCSLLLTLSSSFLRQGTLSKGFSISLYSPGTRRSGRFSLGITGRYEMTVLGEGPGKEMANPITLD